MAKYRQKANVIEALRWRGFSTNLGVTVEPADQPAEIMPENMNAIQWEPLPTWLPRPLPEVIWGRNSRCPVQPGEIRRDGDLLYFGTDNGELVAGPGDWLIYKDGKVRPCPAAEFADMYEAV